MDFGCKDIRTKNIITERGHTFKHSVKNEKTILSMFSYLGDCYLKALNAHSQPKAERILGSILGADPHFISLEKTELSAYHPWDRLHFKFL